MWLSLGDYFHATADKQVIRERAFEAVRGERLRVDVTILERSKGQPRIRADDATRYKLEVVSFHCTSDRNRHGRG
jgi:hypothetical protein